MAMPLTHVCLLRFIQELWSVFCKFFHMRKQNLRANWKIGLNFQFVGKIQNSDGFSNPCANAKSQLRFQIVAKNESKLVFSQKFDRSTYEMSEYYAQNYHMAKYDMAKYDMALYDLMRITSCPKQHFRFFAESLHV